jgi:uncharacterized membrane protein
MQSVETTVGPAAGGSSTDVRRLFAHEPWLFVFVAVTAVADASASIIRYVHLQSGLDLAIFDQAVWRYSNLQSPYSTIKFENLLGDHFHPIVALLAPLYWVWSDPRMLLIAQSALIAASIIPVFLFAEPRLGRAGAYLLAAAYATFWAIQVGVLFDFHEVAFAPLLIALTVLFADRRRFGWMWVAVALLLCVKEDLSVYVVFLGIYLLTKREYRQGLALVIAGIVWYELVTKVFIPNFANGHAFQYWTYSELGGNPLSAVWTLIHEPWKIFSVAFSPGQKAGTIVLLLAPFFFLCLCSRVFILALPLLAERFYSTTPALWTAHFHYSLSVAPVLAMGAAAGLANLVTLLRRRQLLPARHARTAITAVAAAMLLASIVVTRFESADSALAQLTSPQLYHEPPYAAAAERAISHVPASASVATVDSVLAHLSDRDTIEQLGPFTVAKSHQYVVVNVLHITCCGETGSGSYGTLGAVFNEALAQLTPVYYDDGWLVARQPGAGHAATNGVLAPMPGPTARAVDRPAVRFSEDLATINPRLFGCYLRWNAHDPRAAGCFAASLAGVRANERQLVPALRAAVADTTGGCAALARASLAATQGLERDVARIDPSASAPNRTALPAAVARLVVDEQDLDLQGFVGRLVVLCTPRHT